MQIQRMTSQESLFPPIKLPPVDLPTEDGIPLESNWHRAQINLLVELVHSHWRNHSDYFAGGNMFIHYCVDQIQQGDYRGPDFFVAKHVDSARDRGAWIVWAENGRYPDVIVELSSSWTLDLDLGVRKDLY